MAEQRGKVTEIKLRIERGEYRVDEFAVADAVLARLRVERRVARERRERDQTRCSYPERPEGASSQVNPSPPASTRPIQVMPPWATSRRWAS